MDPTDVPGDGPYILMKMLGKSMQSHNGGISLLLSKARALEGLCDKLRSEPAKAAILELLGVVTGLSGSKDELIKAFNAAAASVKSAELKKKVNEVTTIEAGTQSPCWWDIGGAPAQPTTGGDAGLTTVAPHSWTEVVKKGRKQKLSAPQVERSKPEKPTPTRTRGRARPSAILVDIGGAEFPELVSKIRAGVNQEITGDSVVGMRQAKSGGLLIEVRGDHNHIEAVRAEVARSAGPEVSVKSLQQRALVEILDLDQWTGSDEVNQAVVNAASIGQDGIKVVSLRKRFGGTQLALVSLPQEAARRLTNAGRLRIGMVSCRVRPTDTKVRCFRCLTFGHMSDKCGGPDRTTCCRRCGEDGHKAAACSATELAVRAFTRVVQASISTPGAGSYRPDGATEDRGTPK